MVFLDSAVELAPSDYDESGYYSPRAALLRGWVRPVMGAFNRLRLWMVERVWQAEPGRLLDVGCGKGRFLAAARAAGWEVVGLEPTERSWRVAVEEFELDVIPELFRDDHFPDDHFDVVTMWHTLEHIPDPVQVVQAIYDWLVPGGMVVIAVPNYDSFQARLGQDLWFQLDPPHHLYHFTPRTVKQLLTVSGFAESATHFFYPELNEFSMMQTVLNRLGFSPNLLFNLLKRNRAGLPSSRSALALNLIGAVAFLGITWPALLLMTQVEQWLGRGGTMVLAARKPL
jgi:2-polyprenyl-3-methyl-5-hydroxy-6-metoxy-1,4-benzoquinol methylase